MSSLIFSKHRAGPATFYLRQGSRLEVHVNGAVLAIVAAEDVERYMLVGPHGIETLAKMVIDSLPQSLDIDQAPVHAWLRMWRRCNYRAVGAIARP